MDQDKSGYLHILHAEEFAQITHIAMIHGDDQYDFHSIWNAAQENHAIQLGSRHLEPASKHPCESGNHAPLQLLIRLLIAVIQIFIRRTHLQS